MPYVARIVMYVYFASLCLVRYTQSLSSAMYFDSEFQNVIGYAAVLYIYA